MRSDLKYQLLRFIPIVSFILVGVYAIFLFDPKLALFYLAFSLIYALLQGYHCASCPYYGENCPIFLGRLIKVIFKFKPRPRHPILDIILVIPSFFIFLFPQYWLLKAPLLFAIFWGLIFISLIDLQINLCPHCENFGCSLNRNKKRKGEKNAN